MVYLGNNASSNKMIEKILSVLTSKKYWAGLLIIAMAMESGALFYQYVLDYYPCVLCIHVRIITLGIMIVSLLALYFHKQIKLTITFHIINTAMLTLLLERSYQLLGVERGFVTGDCSMNSGLPSWFAVDQWLPWLFKIWEPCGYTPELLLGVTMAEALIVLSPVLLLISIIVTVTLLFRRSN